MKVNYRDYYYKYKALKYYLKNNPIEKQKQIEGEEEHRKVQMIDINTVIQNAKMYLIKTKQEILRSIEKIEILENTLLKDDYDIHKAVRNMFSKSDYNHTGDYDKDKATIITLGKDKLNENIKTEKENIEKLNTERENFIKTFLKEYEKYEDGRIKKFIKTICIRDKKLDQKIEKFLIEKGLLNKIKKEETKNAHPAE